MYIVSQSLTGNSEESYERHAEKQLHSLKYAMSVNKKKTTKIDIDVPIEILNQMSLSQIKTMCKEHGVLCSGKNGKNKKSAIAFVMSRKEEE